MFIANVGCIVYDIYCPGCGGTSEYSLDVLLSSVAKYVAIQCKRINCKRYFYVGFIEMPRFASRVPGNQELGL